MQKAKLISADFESNIVELRTENGFIAKAGEYIILSKEEFEELSEAANRNQ